MWKPWQDNDTYEIPPKPEGIDAKMDMVWEYCFNHLPSRLRRQERRLHWQDVKLNFILVLLALILASLGARLF